MYASVEAPRPRLKFQFLEHTARQNMNPYAEGGDPLSSVFAPSKYGQEQVSQASEQPLADLSPLLNLLLSYPTTSSHSFRLSPLSILFSATP
jgi:hypothetical protein